MSARLHNRKGKYVIIIEYKDKFGKQKQKWTSTGLPVKNNKRRAEEMMHEKLREFEAQMERKDEPRSLGMNELVQMWLTVRKAAVRGNSYESYRQVAELQVIPYFEALGLPAAEIKPVHIQDYYTAKHSEGLTAATLEKHRTVIRGAFEYARNTLELIEHNPAQRATLPRKEPRIPQFYSEAQLKELFKAVRDESIETAVLLSGTYGFRRSEVLALKWRAVDFERKTIEISSTIVRNGTSTIVSGLVKTQSSRRTMPMTSEIEAYLRELKEKQKRMKKLCGKSYYDSDFICVWDDGRPLEPDYVTGRFRRFLKAKGFTHIRFHDLRHSSASLLAKMGFSLKEIQEWLGHADIESTSIYAHLLYESKENMAEKIGKALFAE